LPAKMLQGEAAGQPRKRRADMTPEEKAADNRARKARAAMKLNGKDGTAPGPVSQGGEYAAAEPAMEEPVSETFGTSVAQETLTSDGSGEPQLKKRRADMTPEERAADNRARKARAAMKMNAPPAGAFQAALATNLWSPGADAVWSAGVDGAFFGAQEDWASKKSRKNMTPEERAEDNRARKARKAHGIAMQEVAVMGDGLVEDVNTEQEPVIRKPRAEMTPEERAADNRARKARAAFKKGGALIKPVSAFGAHFAQAMTPGASTWALGGQFPYSSPAMGKSAAVKATSAGIFATPFARAPRIGFAAAAAAAAKATARKAAATKAAKAATGTLADMPGDTMEGAPRKRRADMTPEERRQDNRERKAREQVKWQAQASAFPYAMPWMPPMMQWTPPQAAMPMERTRWMASAMRAAPPQQMIADATAVRVRKSRAEMTPEEKAADNRARKLRSIHKALQMAT